MFKKMFLVFVLLSFAACNQSEGPVQSIEDLQARVSKINQTSQQLEMKRQDLFAQVRQFNATLPDSEQFDIASFDTLMGVPEKELLKAMFKEEKDISYSGLLKTIIAKNEEVAELRQQIDEVRELLPKPYSVKKGDTHYEVVMSYLTTQHGLTEREAFQVAWRTSLIDEILPGNEIWLMYKDGIVGSFVTQGTAEVSPMTAHVMAKKRLLDRVKAAEEVFPPEAEIEN